jgi:hypothetical protein
VMPNFAPLEKGPPKFRNLLFPGSSWTKRSMMEITECPRDAIQGISRFIPTEAKARYLNDLLRAGFDRIDFGSFVSPKAIPQLADTA